MNLYFTFCIFQFKIKLKVVYGNDIATALKNLTITSFCPNSWTRRCFQRCRIAA